jgi:hypothetical protein
MARVKSTTTSCPAKDGAPKSVNAEPAEPCQKKGLDAGSQKELDETAFTYSMTDGAQLLGLNPQAWALSRPLDEARIDRLAHTQAERVTHGVRSFDLFLPTPITIAMLQGPLPRCIVMDGRLRLEVLRRLAGGGIDPATVRLSLCEVRCASLEEVEELHSRLNAGAALPPLYYKKKFAEWLDEFAEALAEAFPRSVSASDQPRRPNFNKVLVKKELARSSELRSAVAAGKLTVASMLTVLRAENEIEGKLSAFVSKNLTASLIAKAKKSGFALGLRSNWLMSVAVRALALIQ